MCKGSVGPLCGVFMYIRTFLVQEDKFIMHIIYYFIYIRFN